MRQARTEMGVKTAAESGGSPTPSGPWMATEEFSPKLGRGSESAPPSMEDLATESTGGGRLCPANSGYQMWC